MIDTLVELLPKAKLSANKLFESLGIGKKRFILCSHLKTTRHGHICQAMSIHL